MTRSFRSLSFALLAAGVAAPGISFAQDDYFRELESPRQIAPVVQLNPQEEERYNLLVGAVRFNLAAGAGIEYNDNITLSDNNRQDDFIFRPSLQLETVWPITELNTLRFSLGLSYAKYFEHSDFDTRGVLLSPNSELALTMHVGNVAITFRDRFSYQEDPFDVPVLSNVSNYRRFQNLAGLQAEWSINPTMTLTAGYNHYNLWTHDNEFSAFDKNIDTVYVRPSIKVAPSTSVGLNASASSVRHTQDILNDGTSYLVGPFIDMGITESTRVYLEGGYQNFSFDDNGLVLDNEDANDFYLKGEIDNRLTENINWRLSLSKTAETGFNSNFYDLYHAEWAADWKLTPGFAIDPVLFYEHYETSSDGEKADRFGAILGLRYVVTPAITFGADYRFVLKDSDQADADYYQNLVLLSVFYNF